MEAISADSRSQSCGSSWMMQSESTHRYLIFKSLVILTASTNVCGNIAKGIRLFQSSMLSFNVLIKREVSSPQQWLRHTYGAISPFEINRRVRPASRSARHQSLGKEGSAIPVGENVRCKGGDGRCIAVSTPALFPCFSDLRCSMIL